MCLSVKLGRPGKKTGVGWKVFRQSRKGGRLTSRIFDTDKIRPIRKWITASDKFIYPGDGGPEEAGFHIYMNREDAMNALIYRNKALRKVRYRKAIQYGLGDGCFSEMAKVVIAKQIYIMSADRT